MAKFITLTDGQNRITVNIDYIKWYEANNGNRGSQVYIDGYQGNFLAATENPNDIRELIRAAYIKEE